MLSLCQEHQFLQCWRYIRPWNLNIDSLGCDVLPDVIKSCSIKPQYVEYVERVKPDVLYIVARWESNIIGLIRMESNLRHAPSSIEQSFVFRPLYLKNVDDGMLPLEDSVFDSALNSLQKLEALVKKKIFILNAFHNINP